MKRNNKYLIKNWRNAYKALSVILPTVGSFCLLLVSILEQASVTPLIKPEYVPYITTIVIPLLAWTGRIIPQHELKLGDKENNR